MKLRETDDLGDQNFVCSHSGDNNVYSKDVTVVIEWRDGPLAARLGLANQRVVRIRDANDIG